MAYLAIVFSALLTLAAAGEITFRNCPNGNYGTATAVRLSPCPKQPCEFKHGDTVNVEIDFIARNQSDVLESKVFGIVAGFPAPFPLPNPDACKESGITCPISAGQKLTYNSSFPVLPGYPKIQVVVMWQLNAGQSNQVCFTFPMAITDWIQQDSNIVG